MNSAPDKSTEPKHLAAPATPGLLPAPKPKTSFALGIWIVIILIIIGLVAGIVPRWLHRGSVEKETKELAISTVQVVTPVPGKSSTALDLPAEIHALQEAPIYARASGFLKRWYVDIGANVEAGQLLADIDTPELDQQLSEAQAQLVQSQAAMALAKITAERWAGLLKTASVSEQENAEKQADLQLKLATVDAAKANVHRYSDLQSFTHVLAPFAGTITARDIDIGDLISSGKELFRLADVSKLRIFVRVPQTASLSIATNVNAELTIPEIPGRKFLAKVVRTAGAIDTSSRTLLTELEVDNAKGEIFAGSYAQVSFPDLKQDPALVLPANTLLFRAEGLQVGVVESNNAVVLKNIVMGRDFGRTVEILSGVQAGDRVIVNPADSLTAGANVRIAMAPTEEKK